MNSIKIKCKECGYENNPPKASYCGKCGSRLSYSTNILISENELNSLKRENKELRREIESLFSYKIKKWCNEDIIYVLAFFIFFFIIFSTLFLIPEEQKDLVITTKNSMYGIKSKNVGFFSQKLKCNYDLIEEYEGCYILMKSGQYGLANSHGKKVIETKFDSIAVINKKVILTYQEEKVGWVNSKGKEILPCEYYSIVWEKGITPERSFHNIGRYIGNIIQAKKNKEDEWTLYNIKGKQITKKTYTAAVQTGEPNLIKVNDGKGYGLINSEGEEILACMYEGISYFNANRAWCEYSDFTNNINKLLCIDNHGKMIFQIIIDPDKTIPWTFNEDGTMIAINNILTYYDINGNIIIPPKYKYIKNSAGKYYNPSFINGKAIVYYDDYGFGYIDKKGNFTPSADLK
ncbi:MAG: WG repeat-containing protein [Bacteroidetes bacterium]|uniref:WG repeat-containing protein n=1 Tax=Candidatus Gallipaludibacter merdavium TaxID=2840839 RepID=A0A9D9HVC2_9BACT|nr:WG repeat-containing protein [Candidatus Gallipaludibacter merdavium]